MTRPLRVHSDVVQGSDSPTVEAIAEARLSELKAFLVALDSAVIRQQISDDETFSMLVELAIDDYGVKQTVLAELLQTQTSTIGRWRLGRSVPSIYARPGIVAAISAILSQQIAEREQ